MDTALGRRHASVVGARRTGGRSRGTQSGCGRGSAPRRGCQPACQAHGPSSRRPCSRAATSGTSQGVRSHRRPLGSVVRLVCARPPAGVETSPCIGTRHCASRRSDRRRCGTHGDCRANAERRALRSRDRREFQRQHTGLALASHDNARSAGLPLARAWRGEQPGSPLAVEPTAGS